MKPGRRARPSEVREQLGNPGHKKKNAAEPQPEPLTDHVAPDFLDATAKTEWQRIAPILSKHKLLSELDRNTLAQYCTAFSDFIRYSKFLSTNGETFETPTGQIRSFPQVVHRAKAWTQMLKIGVEFGLSPSSRAGLSAEMSEDNAQSILDKILED